VFCAAAGYGSFCTAAAGHANGPTAGGHANPSASGYSGKNGTEVSAIFLWISSSRISAAYHAQWVIPDVDDHAAANLLSADDHDIAQGFDRTEPRIVS